MSFDGTVSQPADPVVGVNIVMFELHAKASTARALVEFVRQSGSIDHSEYVVVDPSEWDDFEAALFLPQPRRNMTAWFASKNKFSIPVTPA